MLAVCLIAIILVVVLFAAAIIMSMSGNIRDAWREVRRLNAKLDRHIEAHMAPAKRREYHRARRENEARKSSEFEHGV